MPIYEYECEEDGEVVSMLRPMAEADRPIEDPRGLGRSFKRRLSVFGVGAAAEAVSPPGTCPCGVDAARCGRLG